MKLWSPTRAFVGLAAAGLVALLGTTANASENIDKNLIGLNPQGLAGMDLNPGGSGQVLVGGLIDVRDNDGVQINNIQILNQKPAEDAAHMICPSCIDGFRRQFQQTQIGFNSQDFPSFRGVSRRHHTLEEQTGQLTSCWCIHLTIDGDDAPKSTDPVGIQSTR